MSETLPNLNLNSETEEDIEQALRAGLEVISHTDPLSVPGWNGAGYMVLNPATGSGAYLISGGSNGGYLAGALLGISAGLFVVTMSIAVVATGPLGVAALLLVVLTVVTALMSVITLLINEFTVGEVDGSCFISGFIHFFAGIVAGFARIPQLATQIIGAVGLMLGLTSLKTPRECGVI